MAAAERRLGGRVCVIVLFSVAGLCQSLSTGGQSYTRKLSFELNPGSSSPPADGDLLHVRAVGDNDTLHFLFCSLGAPTLLLVHTNTSLSTVKVNWTQLIDRNSSGGLEVEPTSSVLYSTAIVLSRLLEYDDVNETARPPAELFPPYELKDFSWSRLNASDPTAPLCGTPGNFTAGSLCLRLSAFETEGRGEIWPHLLHTANSSQLEVWLDGLLPRATRSRFLFELQAVGGAYPPSRVETHQTIDDEFTPSIFKVSQWISALNGSSEVLGFVQWKPVAYRQPDANLEDATSCHNSDPLPQSGRDVSQVSSLVRAFYSEPEAFGLNISFGLAGDPFYNTTRFLRWTALVGSGTPPIDGISPLVVGVLAVGLGIPMVLLLLGGVCVCVRKRAATTSYEPIN